MSYEEPLRIDHKKSKKKKKNNKNGDNETVRETRCILKCPNLDW